MADTVHTPESDAEAIHKSMAGTGYDSKALVEILCNRTNDHIQKIRVAYEHKFKTPLHRDIDSETAGGFQEALMGLLMTPSEFDVRCINTAMKGSGCNEEVLLDHLTHRTAAEMTALEQNFLQVVGRTLQHDLKAELSGDVEKFFLSVVEGTKKGALQSWKPEDLEHDAELIGSSKVPADTFIEIMTMKGPAYCHALDDVLAKKTGETLEGALTRLFSGTLKKGLSCLMMPHDEFYARRIDASLAGMGYDADRLAHIVISRRPFLAGISEAHKKLYNSTLRRRLEDEGVTGDLMKVIISITTGI